MAKKKNNQVASLSGEDGWSKIFEMQGESLSRTMDKQKAEETQRELDIATAAELFHKLWGECKDSTYNKDNWKKLQLLLDKLGISV